MRRFIVVMMSLLVIISIGTYLYFVQGYYIKLDRHSSISTPFFVDKNEIYNNDKPFIIKGVEVNSSYGPNKANDFSISEDTWIRWFQMIQQMGANTIRASTVYNDTFYNAFYKYNIDNKQPLYLLQGMQVTIDEMILKSKDYENSKFNKILKKDGKDVIDIVHGRKILLTNKYKGNGIYQKDISPWVLGFLIGDDWNQDSIAFINSSIEQLPAFDGAYVTTAPEATNFEIMLAKIIEEMVGYESRKYDVQHPVSINSSFNMDPFQYKEHYAAQIGKFNRFKMEHIRPTDQLEAGLFASYAYEDIKLPLLEMIEAEELYSFSDLTSYIDLLYQSHDMPIIISSVGHPSDNYFNAENKQEVALLDDLQQFDSTGFNGVIIRSWQDVWDRRSFETSYSVDLQQISEWHDPLTPTQHFGILGFKPYRNNKLMEIDGNNEDWEDVRIIFEDDNNKILMTRDHTYLYLWLENPSITAEQPLYLALDTNPKIGSSNPDIINVEFDRKIDFLMKIDAKDGGSMYVQERYQSTRENFLEYVTGENPFEMFPEKYSNHFESMKYLKEEQVILTEEQIYNDSISHYRYQFKDMNKLVIFNEKKEQEADIAIMDGFMEIQIPYQLLNVYNPLEFTIHDDYYEHYGIEPLKINHLYFSLANQDELITKSVRIPIESLGTLEHLEEYLKPAFDKIKEYWKEGS